MAEGAAALPGAEGVSGRRTRFDLLRHNLGMAGALEEYLAPSFGPGGRAKLFLDPKGRPVPTTDGAKILSILDSPHPVARIVAKAAEAQDVEWRDGTKRAALLALRLLRRAEDLLDAGVPPARIVSGYEIALRLAEEAARRIAAPADPVDGPAGVAAARQAIGTWLPPGHRESLAEAAAAAVRRVAVREGTGWTCDPHDVHVVPKAAGGFSVELVDGYVLDRSRDDPTLPARVPGARIALFDAAPIRGKAGIHEPRLRWIGETKVKLKSPGELDAYADVHDRLTKEVVDGLSEAGANVVLCRLGISDYGHKLLARAGILGIRRIMKTKPMVAIARACGASLIKDFREVRPEQLGRADLVEERRIGDSKVIVITGCRNPRVVTLLVLGPGEAAAAEYATHAFKAVGAAASLLAEPRTVPGGAGIEVATARRVRRRAPEVEGREQLAVEAFAASLEDLAAMLAANLGLNPLDSVLELRRRASSGRPAGLAASEDRWGISPDAPEEPLAPHLGAWRRAVDTTRTILRVDDFRRRAGKREGRAGDGDAATPSETDGSASPPG